MSVSKENQLLSPDKKLNDLSNIKEFINIANSRLDAISSITNNSHAIAADAVQQWFAKIKIQLIQKYL